MKELVSIERIDKKKADELLKNNGINRRIIRSSVDFIKTEIESGKFTINGSSIVISKDGVLIDGQHRLTAISELDTEMNMIVVRNVKESVFSTIDSGKSRTAADVLSSKKIPNSSSAASAIKRIIEEFASKRKTSKNGSIKLSNTEILEFYNKNCIEIDETILKCLRLYQTQIKIVTVSVATAMIFLLGRENKTKAIQFIRELFTGELESNSNAALTLRKRLINNKIEGKKLNDATLRALFIIAFRAYKNDRDISKIQINGNSSQYLFKQ